MRQPVHQIEAQRRNTGLADVADRSGNEVEGLNAPDRLLHAGIEVLHPKADARYAKQGELMGERRRHIARVELDCMFYRRIECEHVQQRFEYGGHSIGFEYRGRATAPMQACGGWRGRYVLSNQSDFSFQKPRIIRNDLVSPDELGMAAAIMAERAAIGHVYIERHGFAGLKP
jgi:hypothetical protein